MFLAIVGFWDPLSTVFGLKNVFLSNTSHLQSFSTVIARFRLPEPVLSRTTRLIADKTRFNYLGLLGLVFERILDR